MPAKPFTNICMYLSGWILWGVLLLPQIKHQFYNANLRWLYIGLFSFILSLLITPLVRKAAIQLQILDQPAQRKVHKDATPLMGGLAINISFVAAILFNNIFDTQLVVILFSATLIMLIGLVDDARSLSAKLKLLMQLLAAALVFWAGVSIDLFPVAGVSEAGKLFSLIGNITLTFLWIVGITNAMNFIDGIDGLATGLSIVISFFLGIVAYQTGQPFLAWLAVAMIGSCLGFLPYNFRRSGPATIFLGDAGSTFIGFTLACLAITGNWAVDKPIVSICTPIMIFGVLIFDMTHTTIARIATGKVRSFHDWVAYTGKDHIHHKMYEIFQNNRKAVFLILGISSCLGISAVVLRTADTFESLLMLTQGTLAFTMLSAVNYYQTKTLKRFQEKRSSFRIKTLFSILLTLEDEDEETDGFVLDISKVGARILVPNSLGVEVGSVIAIVENDTSSDPLSLPSGSVVWMKPSMIHYSGDTDGYMECGIQFLNPETRNIVKLAEKIHAKQIIKTLNGKK